LSWYIDQKAWVAVLQLLCLISGTDPPLSGDRNGEKFRDAVTTFCFVTIFGINSNRDFCVELGQTRRMSLSLLPRNWNQCRHWFKDGLHYL
jgi:hypothetical protein